MTELEKLRDWIRARYEDEELIRVSDVIRVIEQIRREEEADERDQERR